MSARIKNALRHWAWTAGLVAAHGVPRLGLHYRDGGIGDELLCSAVLHELRRRRASRIWVLAKNPDLFANNPSASSVLPFDSRIETFVRATRGKVLFPYYGRAVEGHAGSWRPLRVPVIAAMCALAGIRGRVALRPYVYLTNREIAAGRLVTRQIAIQSSGLGAQFPALNKQWPAERLQAVVDLFHSQFNFVQLGSRCDPRLQRALDLRGKTSLRQSAAVLASSMLFVGLEGFLVHLARAVNCRSVAVFGGRTPIQQYGYSCNENVATHPPCSPCWQDSQCDFARTCTNAIHPEHVAAALARSIDKAGVPLETAEFDLPETWSDLEQVLWADAPKQLVPLEHRCLQAS